MTTNDSINVKKLPEIQSCLACGGNEQNLESMLPEGRKAEVWRVRCSCGQAPARWSVSEAAAIRLWNRHLTENA